MLFIKEYKEYQIYSIEDLDIAGSNNSRLLNNKVIIFKNEDVEIGKEVFTAATEDEAIHHIELLVNNKLTMEERMIEAAVRSKSLEKRNEEKRRIKENRFNERNK